MANTRRRKYHGGNSTLVDLVETGDSFPPGFTSRRWLARHWAHLLLVGLTLVGGGLRFYDLGGKTLWLDEAFSVWLADHGPLALIEWVVRIDQHPPLYYLALSVWMRVFGDLPGAVRGLSALCSTLTIPLFYLIAKRISHDRWTALLATGILALSPFHVRFAQEARMYALLTLLAGGAIYGAIAFLQRSEGPLVQARDWLRVATWRGNPAMGPALTLAFCQTGAMWTHNTAAVFLPLALNLPVLGCVFYRRWRAQPVSLPAVNLPGFLRAWLGTQAVAFLLWLPWLGPFVRQVRGVDQAFWIPAPDIDRIVATFQSFAFAHLYPTGINGALLLFYLVLAGLGLRAMRRQAAWAWFLASLWLTPIAGELLVSLRRPIFYDRTLIWTTLAFYLLMALGIRSIGRRGRESVPPPRWARLTQVGLALLVAGVSVMALGSYYRHFEKEGWADAAAHVAQEAAADDLILFNATWVQIPFEYYFRHYDRAVELRGVPSDLFDSGQLEPQMTPADLPRLEELIEGRSRVWLVYSHDWYTDPTGLIPRTLEATLDETARTEFPGLQIFEYRRQ
jgi:mannosyltransferase